MHYLSFIFKPVSTVFLYQSESNSCYTKVDYSGYDLLMKILPRFPASYLHHFIGVKEHGTDKSQRFADDVVVRPSQQWQDFRDDVQGYHGVLDVLDASQVPRRRIHHHSQLCCPLQRGILLRNGLVQDRTYMY